MGEILANSGPKYRKERPASARPDEITPAMSALLDDAVLLGLAGAGRHGPHQGH